MLEIIRYSSENKQLWDSLIKESRNGTFLFYRDYMDYHSNRFNDCSYLIRRKGKISAVIPGNIENETYYSHQGLTYGGLVLSKKISTTEIMDVFDMLNVTLKKEGIKYVYYKPVPLIYHKLPAQEDIYTLFRIGAEKIACNISSTIYQNNKIKFIESRKSGIRKSIREGIEISESIDYDGFWKILEANLSGKFNKKPVHNVDEIKLLNNRFPDNIKLHVATRSGNIIAGTVLYLMENIVHVQYISASEEGREKGALDHLFDVLINSIYSHIPIFDFGQSTEDMGNYLNENLIFQKEGFGGRGIVYDIYKYSI